MSALRLFTENIYPNSSYSQARNRNSALCASLNGWDCCVAVVACSGWRNNSDVNAPLTRTSRPVYTTWRHSMRLVCRVNVTTNDSVGTHRKCLYVHVISVLFHHVEMQILIEVLRMWWIQLDIICNTKKSVCIIFKPKSRDRLITLEVFLNDMRYINLRFTYLLTY